MPAVQRNARISAPILVMLCVFTAQSARAAIPSFDVDVQPILAKHCVHCHGEKPRNNLDLRTRDGLIKGGKTGQALYPGSLRESLIWSFIATDKMPADDGKLNAQEKDTLRRWILSGAPQTAKDAAQLAAQQRPGASAMKRNVSGVESMAAQIDRWIDAGLRRDKIDASPISDDAEFLRRVFLDLNGRIPSYEETIRFLESNDRQKRDKLIDERLASPEFGEHMAIVWHKLLIPKSAGAYSRIPHAKFRKWLAEQFNGGRSWDQIVTELITAEGYLASNKDNEIARKKDAKLQPQNVATAFINVHNTEGRPQPKGIIASVSRLFLAQSIECAQCHNHPLAKWERTDFWAAAAFFERVRYEKAVYNDTSIGKLQEPATGKDLIYEDKAKARYAFVPGVYQEPVIDLEDANGKRTGEMIRARFLDGTEPELDSAESYRGEFANWVTARENPYFARALVNRVWSQLLGRGFVEPVDDMAEDNRPSHPELLSALSAEFAASGHDIKHLVRCICRSEAYGRTSAPMGNNTADHTRFSKQALKQLTEEQLLKSLQVALPTFAQALEEDAQDKNPGRFKLEFLETHETDPGTATEHTRGLQQALRMMNGDGRLFNREAIADRVSATDPVAQNIERIYLQALNRRPSGSELDRMTQYVETAATEIEQLDPKRLPQRRKDQPDNTPDAYSDVLWVLINSGEFIFNH